MQKSDEPLYLLKPINVADIAGLQQPDGSFFGDDWGEVDTRLASQCLADLSENTYAHAP